MKKRILLLTSSVFVLMLTTIFQGNVSAAEIHACTGSGEKCVVEVDFNGQTATIKSEKKPGSASVIVKE